MPVNNRKDSLVKTFNRFAGRDVLMKDRVTAPKTPGGPEVRRPVPVQGYAEVLKEMRDAARAAGFGLFVEWPGHELKEPRFAKFRKRPDRIVARIEKSPDGRWWIARDFRFG